MSAREKIEKMIEGYLYLMNKGMIPQDFAMKMVGILNEALEKYSDEDLDKALNSMKNAIKQFFELYAKKTISWRDKLDLFRIFFSDYMKYFGDEVYKEWLGAIEYLKATKTEEEIAKGFEVLRFFFMQFFLLLEYKPFCKCGKPAYYPVITYEDEIPVKAEFFCEDCASSLSLTE
jgi:hypothetical protein